MIGYKFILQPYHLPPARDIYSLIRDDLEKADKPYFISIGGESSCGKSTLSIAVKEVLLEHGFKSFIIHMDDYYHLPPTSNYHQRMDDINHVGPQEVDFEQLQQHIEDIRNGAKEIIKPLIHYKENDKRSEIFYPQNSDVILIEGTYVSLLNNIDTKIFMVRTFKDTLKERDDGTEDEISPFMEDVLEIEHMIVRRHVDKANIIVDRDYNVQKVSK